MSFLDGFTSFNFNEGAPYVSITKNGMTFNKGTVMKLRCPEYVRLLINSDQRMIAIQPCESTTENATVFCSEERRNSKVLSIRWNGRDLLNTVSDMMDWDLSNHAFKVEGKPLVAENAMLFDLNKAEELK
ncbi:MAG: hypothetical protein IJU39_01695 [Clostridia bacterium]|nr:hypothetical protein [Clostridia bacterium]